MDVQMQAAECIKTRRFEQLKHTAPEPVPLLTTMPIQQIVHLLETLLHAWQDASTATAKRTGGTADATVLCDNIKGWMVLVLAAVQYHALLDPIFMQLKQLEDRVSRLHVSVLLLWMFVLRLAQPEGLSAA
jgi:hypothetical protein